jgi:Flp pilus assembly protein TadG
LSGDERGQAVVELALVLPLVVLYVLVALQVTLVARDQLAIEHAAREAARAASVSANPHKAANTAANRIITLTPLDIFVNTNSDVVHVHVHYTNPTNIARIGTVVDRGRPAQRVDAACRRRVRQP